MQSMARIEGVVMNENKIYTVDFHNYESRWFSRVLPCRLPFGFLPSLTIKDYDQINIPEPYCGYVYHDGTFLTLHPGQYSVCDILSDPTWRYGSAGLCFYDPRITTSGLLLFMYLELSGAINKRKEYLTCQSSLEVKFIDPTVFLTSMYEKTNSFEEMNSLASEYIAAISKLAIQPIGGAILQKLDKDDHECAKYFKDKCYPHLERAFNRFGIELINWNIYSFGLFDYVDRRYLDESTHPDRRIEPFVCSAEDSPITVMYGEYRTYSDVWFGPGGTKRKPSK